MLKSIRLKNFKNIEDSKIILNNKLVGIYGPNAIGKTAVIEAFDFFRVNLLNNSWFNHQNQADEIMNYLRKDCDSFSYQFEFELDKNSYLFNKKFIVNKINPSDSFYEETVSCIKYNGKKNDVQVYKKITSSKLSDVFSYQIFEIDIKEEESLEAIKHMSSTNSVFFELINKYKLEKMLDKTQKRIIDDIDQLFMTLNNSFVITLKDQSVSNLNVILPVHFSTKLDDDFIAQGVIPLIQFNHYYNEQEIHLIEATLNKISTILKVITDNKTLTLQILESSLINNEIKHTIRIDVVDDYTTINISQESAGVVKLISMISAFVNISIEKNAIMLVDELDAHIFEYLLSTIIKELNESIVGQLIFTSHNLTLFELLQKQNIVIASKLGGKITFSEFVKVNKTDNMRNKYIRSQSLDSESNIGAINISDNSIHMAFLKAKIQEGYYD